MLTPLQMVPGSPELVVILLIVALLFGADRIPKLARSTGQALGEFQKGRREGREELETDGQEANDEAVTESENSPQANS